MNSHDVIKKPLLTEKSSRMSERENKYSFRVAKSANNIGAISENLHAKS
jgi:ribosomal protein L23